jgi:tetratricopeptide (TPR) repeat protein
VSEHARNLSLRTGRFMRLPRRSNETWQGGVVGLPFFVADAESEEPIRQMAIAWANLATNDIILSSVTAPEAQDRDRVLDAFLDLGLRNRKAREGRPARLGVQDESLGVFIKDALRDADLEIVVLPDLPRIEEEIEAIVRSEHDGPPPPGALDAPAVTMERMRAFADAARHLHDRAPWDDIGRQDLVVVEAPVAPDGMACFVVADDEDEPGLEFYSSPERFEEEIDDDDEFEDDEDSDETVDEDQAIRDPDVDFHWRMDYVRVDELPVFDVGLWADSDLPVAGPRAYPVVIKPLGDREFERPDAARLAYLEGLLRAMAETTEADVDSGRWTRTVETADGALTYRLSIPSLLDEPIQGQPSREEEERSGAILSRFLAEGGFEDLDQAIEELERSGRPKLEYQAPRTQAEKAQDQVYRAQGAPGRRRTQLLREAMALSPDCVDAYVHLGESTTNPAKALELFEAGLAAAERVILPDRLESLKGRYWQDQQTRSCLRGRFGLATTLQKLGRADEAIGQYRALMSLDRQDHAGAGHQLLVLLLEEGRDPEAGALLSEVDDGGPEWAYGSSLWAYRNRPIAEARKALEVALEISPRVARLLVISTLDADERAELTSPDEGDAAHAEVEEAFDLAMLWLPAWNATPGAIEWLAAELERSEPRRRRSRRGRGRRRGR